MSIPSETPVELIFRELIARVILKRAEERGGYLSWSELEAVTLPDGSIKRAVDPGRGGIWNPSELDATLSIVTSPDGPYADQELAGGLLTYHYQSGPVNGKNLKLRRAMELGYPVIRFQKIAKATYMPIYPVYVIGDDPAARVFTLSVDQSLGALPATTTLSEIERRYAERVIRQRVHQPAFRARVMLAYQTQCAVCVLKKAALLDAAHIIGDRHDEGLATVTNGLSLCKIHHTSYDANLLGITPDYRVQINHQLLMETDGPMLLHGLQEMHGRMLALPVATRDRPDQQRLDTRYQDFPG